MKISFCKLQEEFRQDFNVVSSRHISKLEKLLKRYVPDLVQLHGAFEQHPRKTQYDCSLNLILPTGTLHATGEGPDVRQSTKLAFLELESQVKKHQARLRKDYEWKRKRERTLGAPAPAVD